MAENPELVGGSACGVFAARDLATQRKVALKKVAFTENEGVPAWALREISMLKSLRHEHVIQLLDVDYAPQSACLFQVMEWMETSLDKVVGVLEVGAANAITRQVLLGLEYLHARGIAHRNLSPSCVLIAENGGGVKLTGFGFAAMGTVPLVPVEDLDLWYVAPERLQAAGSTRSEAAATQGDLWSLGVCYVQMLTGRVLWPGTSASHQLALIASVETAPHTLATTASNPALVDGLLCFQPESRLTAAQALALV